MELVNHPHNSGRLKQCRAVIGPWHMDAGLTLPQHNHRLIGPQAGRVSYALQLKCVDNALAYGVNADVDSRNSCFQLREIPTLSLLSGGQLDTRRVPLLL